MARTYKRECPQCSQQVTWPETTTYPFCSDRCRLIDLGAWANEEYRIPGEPLPESDDMTHLSTPAGENDTIEEET